MLRHMSRCSPLAELTVVAIQILFVGLLFLQIRNKTRKRLIRQRLKLKWCHMRLLYMLSFVVVE